MRLSVTSYDAVIIQFTFSIWWYLRSPINRQCFKYFLFRLYRDLLNDFELNVQEKLAAGEDAHFSPVVWNLLFKLKEQFDFNRTTIFSDLFPSPFGLLVYYHWRCRAFESSHFIPSYITRLLSLYVRSRSDCQYLKPSKRRILFLESSILNFETEFRF